MIIMFIHLLYSLFTAVNLLERQQVDACQTNRMLTEQQTAYVFENDCLELTCTVSQKGPVTISKAPNKVLVIEWNKIGNDSRITYDFRSINNSHLFKINNVSLTDQGVYICLHQPDFPKSIKLMVLTKPDRGTLYAKRRTNTQFTWLTKWLKWIAPRETERLMWVCYFYLQVLWIWLTWRNFCRLEVEKLCAFVLLFRQNLTGVRWSASRYRIIQIMFSTPYKSYCSWGPIVLRENLDVTVHHLSENDTELSEVIFICKCNIMDARFHWHFGPQSLEFMAYDWPGYSISKIDVTKNARVNRDVTVTCKVSYGGRDSNATVEYRLRVSPPSSCLVWDVNNDTPVVCLR